MDTGILLVLAVVLGTLVLFASDLIRVDLVAILACLALAWFGLVTPQEALSGFSSNAVVAMAAVMVLGAGLKRAGVTSRLAALIVRYAGTAERRVVAATSLAVGLLSSVIHNVSAAAVFLPATGRIARRTGIPVSRLMMPIGFAAILGGTVTMIGSGPLIVLNDLLRQAGAEPFSLFAVTPIGIVLLLAGVALFSLAGERIPPRWGQKYPGYQSRRSGR
ncbi:MAG: SLC13 family permease [Methanolinea sp.]|nr:SLC13 family permease [Methanolinea sp.]